MTDGMTRRQVVLAQLVLGALAVPGVVATLAGAATPAAAAEDPLDFVRDLYRRAAARGTLPEREFLAALSGDLRKLWRTRPPIEAGADDQVRAALFGPGASGNGKLAITRVLDIPGLPRERVIAVEFKAEREARQVFVHLSPASKAKGWTILNFIYDVGADFLRVSEQTGRSAG